MNADHRDAIDAYAPGLLGVAGSGRRLNGIDPEGVDRRRGPRTARLTVGQAVADAKRARVEQVRLARLALSQLLAAP